MRLRPPSLTYSNVVSTACLAALLGGSAIAADSLTGSATEKQVTVCSKKKGRTKGQMRLVSSKTKCRKDESKVTWSTQGPAGAQGVQGAQGAKGDAGPAGPVETGLVAFYAASACPAGWAEYTPAQGRYLVGLPAGGANEAAVGTPLGNQENRAVGQHGHGITDPGHSHSIQNVSPILRAGNTTPTRVQGTSGSGGIFNATLTPGSALPPVTVDPTGITVNAAGSVPGTNAPYVQLLACKKV